MSSDKPIFGINIQIFNSSSMTSNLSSQVIDISEHPGYCLHAIWSGTPVGTLSISAGNDGINFVSVVTQAAGGATGQWLQNIEKAHYRYVQVTYTASSSTGSLTAYLSAKDI